jgi:hypothetical protein
MRKITLISLLTIILLGICFLLVPYLISPVFDFSKPQTFAGDGYYNPYQQMDSTWNVCNFHAHSKSWGGLTDGKNTHIDTIIARYQQMGYAHIGISNYQKITHIKKDNLFSIPAYEHGINIKKRHHLCLGADRVSWLDFFFCQTLSHKQFVLNNLKSSTDFLTINHPKFANSFDESDFIWLSNYDAIEVLNHYRTSVKHWDSALSSGYYVVLFANDDMHRLNKMDETGANFTVVNTNALTRYDVIQALKAGQHYGVKAYLKTNENYQTKAERIAHLIHLNCIEMKEDTLVIQLDTEVAVMRLIGQGGVVKDSATSVKEMQYVFQPTDTYIRIEIEDVDGNLYLFNPVVRTNDQFVINPYRATVNIYKTTCKRISILLFFLLFAFGIFLRKRKIYIEKLKLFFQRPYRLKLLILIILSAIIKIIIASNLELNNDEVYYRLYAMYPDFSHFDHPPMVGWLIQLTSLNLLFDSAFCIRLGAIILSSIILVLAFKIGKKIHSEWAGFIAAFLFCISPYTFLIAGTFILPDTPLIFFWMLALWLIVNIFDGEISTQKANTLLVLGFVIGLGVLSKYTAIFLWIGIGLYILLYKKNYLKIWQLYVSIFITLLCLLPIIYWNVNNDFISFTFHEQRVSLFSEICFTCFLQEIAGELLYNNPFIFGMVFFVFFRFCFRKDQPPFATYNRLFYCIGFPVVILFILFSLFRPLLPHWNAPGYTVMIFPVAIYMAEKLQDGKKMLWRQAQIWAGVLFCIVVLFLLQLRFDLFQLKKFEIQDFTLELSTWKKTGEAFAQLSQEAERNGEIQPGAPIIATRWFPAANLDMYVAKPTHRKLLALGSMERIHKYVWINSSRGGFHLGMDAWYITDDYDFADPMKIADYFESISSPDTLQIYRNKEVCKEVYVYKLKNMREVNK